jgi:hypothetical protein
MEALLHNTDFHPAPTPIRMLSREQAVNRIVSEGRLTLGLLKVIKVVSAQLPIPSSTFTQTRNLPLPFTTVEMPVSAVDQE